MLCCLVIYDFTHANASVRQALELSSTWKAFAVYPFTWRRSLWATFARVFIENCMEIESVAVADSICCPPLLLSPRSRRGLWLTAACTQPPPPAGRQRQLAANCYGLIMCICVACLSAPLPLLLPPLLTAREILCA